MRPFHQSYKSKILNLPYCGEYWRKRYAAFFLQKFGGLQNPTKFRSSQIVEAA